MTQIPLLELHYNYFWQLGALGGGFVSEKEKSNAQDQDVHQDSGLIRVAFEKLTPASADLSPYQEAFDFVFSRKEVRNVAITGSYGAGKSGLLASVRQFYGAELKSVSAEEEARDVLPGPPQQSKANNSHIKFSVPLQR